MHTAECFAPHSALAASLLQALPPGSDGSHDQSHLLRVWKNARGIQQKEGGDLELLAAAVLLHDCVAVEKNSPQRSQSSRLAAHKAEGLLRNLGWTQLRADRVKHAIEAHSFSAGIAPETLEARILQDADRLDALGSVGIARCFYTAGRMNSRLYDPQDPRAQARELDDRVFALDHFQAKLLNPHDRFQTVEGARMAEQRHQRLERFFHDFLDEVDLTGNEN